MDRGVEDPGNEILWTFKEYYELLKVAETLYYYLESADL